MKKKNEGAMLINQEKRNICLFTYYFFLHTGYILVYVMV